MQYWPAIDGLRAVAVVLVLLFHAKVPLFSGGYVGVDVFFVISGFLITTLICNEWSAGRFTLAGFYERRIRRILPAYALVALATLGIGALVLLPPDLARLGSSTVAATLFVSNFYFWRVQGQNYLLDEREFLPMLHTWSLSIEEQFYLLFPIFALLLLRFSVRRSHLIFLALALLSFAMSYYSTWTHPVAAFYFSPARAWELLLGAWLATSGVKRLGRCRLAPVLQAVGLIMILAATYSFDARTPFPGVAALVPCLGAALLIACRDRDSRLMRGLGHSAFVTLGLISYPLYLWHWPLLVLSRLALLRELHGYEIVAVYSLAGVLAVATWRYVEKPIRARPSSLQTKRAVLLATVMTCLIVAAGGVLHLTRGLRATQFAEVEHMLAAANDFDPKRAACHNWDRTSPGQFSNCIIGDAARPGFDFVLWGDSHAGAIATAVDAVTRTVGRKGLQLTADNCPPLLRTVVILGQEEKADCEVRNDVALGLFLQHRIRQVILAGQWAWYAEGIGFLQPVHPVALRPSDGRVVDQTVGAFELALRSTIDRLRSAGISVMIIGPVPEIGWHVPTVLAAQERRKQPLRQGPSLDEFMLRQRKVLPMLKTLERHGVGVIYPHERLCSATCAVVLHGQILYKDDEHLTTRGAELLQPALFSILAGAGAVP